MTGVQTCALPISKHRHETWERFLRPALADKRGFATFCTTPEGFNWLYDVYMLGQDPDFTQFASWRLPSWENTAVFPGGRQDPEILSVEETTSEEWFLQEYGAEFTAFVGKIYPEFDELKHIKRIEYNPDWPNYIFFDWGFVNALAALEVQVDPFDNVYIWRETYVHRERLEDILEQMKAREQPEGYKIDCAYGDAADPEAALTVSIKLAPCFAEPEAKVNWRAGIETVKRFLKLQPTGLLDAYGEPITTPKLFVDYSCKNTIREFQNYRMRQTRTDNDPPEGPHKKDDHAMDALRYGLVHLFELGAKYHLDSVVEMNSGEDNSDNITLDFGDEDRASVFTQDMRF